MAPIRPQIPASHANRFGTETCMYICMHVYMYVSTPLTSYNCDDNVSGMSLNNALFSFLLYVLSGVVYMWVLFVLFLYLFCFLFLLFVCLFRVCFCCVWFFVWFGVFLLVFFSSFFYGGRCGFFVVCWVFL